MSELVTQLTPASGYNTDRLIFSEIQTGTIPNSKPQISYQRININTRHEDGTMGPLIIPTGKLFSFGVSENTNPETGKVNGFVLPIVLGNRDGPTPEESEWIETFNAIVEKCKDHLIENKEELGQYELERNDLKKLNPLYYKKDKGRIIEGSVPTLYAKLIVSKKHDKIVSMFFDFEGEPVNPHDLIGKYCYTRAAIKIESIFIGNKISLQVKLYECEVKLTESGMRRLLARPKSDGRVLTASTTNAASSAPPMGSDDEDEGSLKGSEDEAKSAAPKKRVVRKVKKVKKTSSDE